MKSENGKIYDDIAIIKNVLNQSKNNYYGLYEFVWIHCIEDAFYRLGEKRWI